MINFQCNNKHNNKNHQGRDAKRVRIALFAIQILPLNFAATIGCCCWYLYQRRQNRIFVRISYLALYGIVIAIVQLKGRHNHLT